MASYETGNAPHLEFLCGQNASPGIENLHDIDARRKLPNEVARGSLDQKLDQLRKRVNIARYRKLLESSANEPER